jgi:hypothetical protein
MSQTSKNNFGRSTLALSSFFFYVVNILALVDQPSLAHQGTRKEMKSPKLYDPPTARPIVDNRVVPAFMLDTKSRYHA